jgi:hypothetical protein
MLIMLWACYPSSYKQKLNIPSINKQILTEEELTFMTPGKKEYQLIVLQMDSLTLEGSGRMRENYKSQWEDYQGSVPLDSIDMLIFREIDYGKSLLINTIAVTLLVKGLAAGEGPYKPTIEFIYPPSGASSCPFIYSWQGNRYVLEGEAFGIAYGKAQEMKTSTVLPNLNLDGENLQVRITNERPETQFFNTISLHVVEIEPHAKIIADNNQDLWPVFKPTNPLSAFDNSERNVLNKLFDRDNQYWESDIDDHILKSDFEDIIELSFQRPNNYKNGSLTIHAINTYFANLVYEKMFEFLGDQALPFLQALENDPEIIQGFNDWIIESSLKVSVWDGTSWNQCGLIFPEANVAPFSRLVRLDIPNDIGDKVKIQLKSVTDIWKIDAVGLDWTPVEKLEKKVVPLLSIGGQLSENQIELIDKKDDQYAVLLPSQKIDLVFKNLAAPEGKNLCYALDVGGYLYEWLPEKKTSSLFAGYREIIGPDRIGFAKFLLKNKSLLLPPLYAEWRKLKQKK